VKQYCLDCNEGFKRQKQLEEHWDRFHSPPRFLPDGRIRLNASDQICLVLKDMMGWEAYFEKSKKLKHFKDLEYAQRLQRFELENSIEFVVCGAEVKSYLVVKS